MSTLQSDCVIHSTIHENHVFDFNHTPSPHNYFETENSITPCLQHVSCYRYTTLMLQPGPSTVSIRAILFWHHLVSASHWWPWEALSLFFFFLVCWRWLSHWWARWHLRTGANSILCSCLSGSWGEDELLQFFTKSSPPISQHRFLYLNPPELISNVCLAQSLWFCVWSVKHRMSI